MRRFKFRDYELSFGDPALPPIVWWISLDRVRPTVVSAGRQLYSSKLFFRLQYQKLPITVRNLQDRWGWVSVA